MDYTTIGKHIRAYRLQRNLRQEEMAERVGLSTNYYGAIERGEKIPSLETFLSILNTLEISADLVLADVLKVGYKTKNSVLDDKLMELPQAERKRIFAVIETLVQYAKQ